MKHTPLPSNITKLEGLVVVLSGWTILVLVPFSLLYSLFAMSGTDRLKAIGGIIILLIAGIIAVRVGRQQYKTGRPN